MADKIKTKRVTLYGKTWNVPAGLTPEEVIKFIQDVIKGLQTEPVSNPVSPTSKDVVVEGKLMGMPTSEIKSQ